MEHLTLKELAELNRLVKTHKSRFLMDCNRPEYFQRPDSECPAFIQKSRKRTAELTALQEKLERMILEIEIA